MFLREGVQNTSICYAYQAIVPVEVVLVVVAVCVCVKILRWSQEGTAKR